MKKAIEVLAENIDVENAQSFLQGVIDRAEGSLGEETYEIRPSEAISAMIAYGELCMQEALKDVRGRGALSRTIKSKK